MALRTPPTRPLRHSDEERRARLSKLHVLVADRDHRTASLVQRILFSFGFRNMDITTNADSMLALLRTRPYDILILELNMEPLDGITLVKNIRTAKDDARIPAYIPILMLTAKSDKENVIAARDAGITEFVAKPFSAKTISNRIIQIIDNPRAFIECANYTGPDRRRRGEPPPGVEDRRGSGKGKITPANEGLKKELGNITAADIINELVVAEAQMELVRAEDDFIDWARQYIEDLEGAFKDLQRQPTSKHARHQMIDAAYAIKSQAGMFGYTLGTEVAGLMLDYLSSRRNYDSNSLIVIGKHIDTIRIIFHERIKESGLALASEMIVNLKKLIFKIG